MISRDASAFTGDEVLNKMSAEAQQSYLAGIVDGLWQARWLKDKPDDTGVICITNWFYKNEKKSLRHIGQLMRRNLDKQANGIIYVLVKKECGW